MLQHADNTETTLLKAHIDTIDQLANQASETNYFGLQDVCLLILEALNERLHNEIPAITTELDLCLQNFPVRVVEYLQNTANAAENIISLLKHPDLNIALIDDEFTLLEQTLTDDSTAQHSYTDLVTENNAYAAQHYPEIRTTANDTQTQYIEKHLSTLENYANEAAEKAQYGLQDVCLLIIDAVQTQQAEANPVELLTLLDSLPVLINHYNQDPDNATDALLAALNQPILNIALIDDEQNMLRTLLIETSTVPQALPANDNNPGLEAATHPILPAASLELVELLVMQAHLIEKLLDEIIFNDDLSSHLESIDDELERYINVSKIAGFAGLAQLCEHVQHNTQYFHSHPDTFTPHQQQLLQTWIGHVKHYLATFTEEDAGLALITHLNDSQWPVALTPDIALKVLNHLRHTNLSAEQTALPKRTHLASDNDVSLTLPSDVNQELLGILLHELPIYTQEFSQAIHNLQQDGSAEDLNVAQRIAHTLKGSANTVGIGGIAVLTHHLEDILEAYAKAHKMPGSAAINILIDAADCLEAMSEFLIGMSQQPPDGARQILQEILDWANQIDQSGLPDQEESTPRQPRPAAVEHTANTTATTGLDDESSSISQQTAMVRVPSEQIDTLLRMSGESLILNSQANERLRRLKAQLLAMDTQFITLQRLSDELEQLIDIQDLTGKTLSGIDQEFDSLEMDQYNELYTTSRRLVEAAFDAREMNLDARSELEHMSEVLEYQQRLVIDTQGAIMQTRLVPVASITSRLQRTLRQTCRLTGKNSELSLSGEQLMIDGDVLNAMIDPLMHILRNAVDHGLESEAERLAAGKPSVGLINLEFDREGNNILVRCRDDGRGLDFAAIRNTAEQRGVIQQDQDVSEEELKRFILRPNFSTRTESTQTSGRGVGMNAVHFQVVSLGGSLNLYSQHGKGLTIELRMPLPISRSHALLAMAGTYRVAITSKGLKQILYAVADDFSSVGGEQILHMEGIDYPVISLNRLLHVAENRKKNQRHSAVLLIEHDEKTSAVLLDSIADSLELVIKDFGHYLKKIPGYIGAAIMGDGAVAPVLDMPALLRLSAQSTSAYVEPAEIIDPRALLSKVLIVDDSLSQRRSLEQLLSDAGFAVHIARDGIEAIELLTEVTPDIILTDLEMPRMNGIELTAHLRTQAQIKNLPIIMITSRTTQKHHKLAEDAGVDFYLVKPVREDDLLSKIQYLLQKRNQ